MAQPHADQTEALRSEQAALVEDRAERAARVKAMLARWETEDLSGESDWDFDAVPRVDLRSPRDGVRSRSP